MSWKNIKNFLIALLLIACIVIGTMLWLSGDQEPYTKESLEKSAALMKESGIIVDSNMLKGNFDGMKLYRFTLPRDYPEQVAQKLLCGNISDVFTVPDGVELRTNIGEVLFVGDDFTIRYACSVQSASITEAEAEEILILTLDSPRFGAARQSNEDSKNVTFIQTLGSYPIPENRLTCSFDDGKLVSMEGKWCFPDKCSTFSAQLHDYLNIMFTERERVTADSAENAEKKTLTVENLEKCYGVESTDSKTAFVLVPSLNITYKEGERATHSAVAN